jgi:UDP-glucose 4-epimerase
MLSHGSHPLAPRRVVILGASGFVGANLNACLASSGLSALPVSSRDVDLTRSGASDTLATMLDRDDALVFVSALTPDKGRDIATMMKNLAMGEEVCTALASRPCAHVVYVSSDAVYADDADRITETSCASPSSYHGLMHLVRERMLATTLAGVKIPLAILRPSLLYGRGDTHNGYGPNRFLRTARDTGSIALFGNGEEQRDHVFIDDVSRVIERVVRSRSAGVLNVATGRSRSFGDVAQIVASVVPGVAIESKPRAGAVTHRSFDTRAFRDAFPDFTFTNLEEGLAHA